MRVLRSAHAFTSEAISCRLEEHALLQRGELHGTVHALVAGYARVRRALRQMLAVEPLHLDALKLGQIVFVCLRIIIMLLARHTIIITFALLVIDCLLPREMFLVESIHF